MKTYALGFCAALALAPTPAMACNSEMLSVMDWQAVENTGNRMLPVLLEAQVRYDGDRPFRMIHAGIMFSDALGQSLGQVNLPRDYDGTPEALIVADGQTGAKERMLTISRDDIVYRTCVWSIVYDDGTVEDFR